MLPLLPQLLTSRQPTLKTPLLAHVGQPTQYFDFPWSLLTWLPGASLLEASIDNTQAMIEPLASWLTALHQPAPDYAPTNPHRGGPLSTRTEPTMRYLHSLGDKIRDESYTQSDIQMTWDNLLDPTPWSARAVWLHGDLHPGNMLAESGGLSAVIDWGDVCSGDPATDLAVVWMLFDRGDRELFIQTLRQLGHPADDQTWRRSQAWVLSLGLAHLSGTDNVMHNDLGRIVIDRTLG